MIHILKFNNNKLIIEEYDYDKLLEIRNYYINQCLKLENPNVGIILGMMGR